MLDMNISQKRLRVLNVSADFKCFVSVLLVRTSSHLPRHEEPVPINKYRPEHARGTWTSLNSLGKDITYHNK